MYAYIHLCIPISHFFHASKHAKIESSSFPTPMHLHSASLPRSLQTFSPSNKLLRHQCTIITPLPPSPQFPAVYKLIFRSVWSRRCSLQQRENCNLPNAVCNFCVLVCLCVSVCRILSGKHASFISPWRVLKASACFLCPARCRQSAPTNSPRVCNIPPSLKSAPSNPAPYYNQNVLRRITMR